MFDFFLIFFSCLSHVCLMFENFSNFLERSFHVKKNILFNIDGKAKEYLGETLKNDVTTVYVDTIEEFNKVILNVDAPSLKSIFEAHKDVLYSDYTKNMDYFLENIL